jgi:hypothetical protein
MGVVELASGGGLVVDVSCDAESVCGPVMSPASLASGLPASGALVTASADPPPSEEEEDPLLLDVHAPATTPSPKTTKNRSTELQPRTFNVSSPHAVRLPPAHSTCPGGGVFGSRYPTRLARLLYQWSPWCQGASGDLTQGGRAFRQVRFVPRQEPFTTVATDHGRPEVRRVWASQELDGFADLPKWKGLRSKPMGAGVRGIGPQFQGGMAYGVVGEMPS